MRLVGLVVDAGLVLTKLVHLRMPIVGEEGSEEKEGTRVDQRKITEDGGGTATTGEKLRLSCCLSCLQERLTSSRPDGERASNQKEGTEMECLANKEVKYLSPLLWT